MDIEDGLRHHSKQAMVEKNVFGCNLIRETIGFRDVIFLRTKQAWEVSKFSDARIFFTRDSNRDQSFWWTTLLQQRKDKLMYNWTKLQWYNRYF